MRGLLLAMILVALVATTAVAQSPTYCVPQSIGFSCSSDEYIANITITDASSVTVLNNSSACVGSPGYEDYTTLVAPVALAAGSTYSVAVTVGQYWSTDQVAIWLDVNQNFSFDDAGEQLVLLSSTAAGSGTAPLTLTGTFTVPTNTRPATRLRARLIYSSFPTPSPSCGNNTFGNTEDYTAVVGGYCIPQATGFSCSNGDEFISNVTIGPLVGNPLLANTSVCGAPPGYENYTISVLPPTLSAGITYVVSVTVGQYWSGDQVRIFLDGDQNFSFEDASEILATLWSTAPGSGTAPVTMTGTITLPIATAGGLTRLRVRLVYSAFPTPSSCGNATFGNTEDYLVAVIPVNPEYQVNQSASSLTLDGVAGTAFTPAVTAKCVNTTGTVCFASTLPGSLWEAALTLSPLVPRSAGGILLPGSQVLNVNFASPTLFYLWGGPAPALVPFAGFCGSFSTGPMPGTVSIQMIILNPSLPTGFALSQGCQLTVDGPGSSIPGPAGDDVAVTIVAGAAPGCFPAINFYGTTYTTYGVSTNGRITLGVASTSFSAANPPIAGDPPFAGVWSDLNTSVGGTITLNNTGSGIRADFNAISYFGGTAAVNSTFRITIDVTGNVTIDNNGLPISIAAGGNNQYVGINPGAATIAAGVPAAPWAPSTYYLSSTPTDAIGVFGPQGSLLAPGTAFLSFYWTLGGYTLTVY